MLRLDRTVSRKTTLHADHDAEERACWQAMTYSEKRETVLVLQQRATTLRAWSEQERNRKAALLSDESTD